MPYKRSRKGKQGNAGRTTPLPPAPAKVTATPSNSAFPPAPLLPTKLPEDLIITSDKRRGVFECDYCHCDISQVPRVRCAVCPDFDLCLECFTTTDHAAASARLRAALETQKALQDEGTKVTQTTTASTAALHHDNTHGYRVCDSTRYPLFPTAKHVATWKGNASPYAAALTNTTATSSSSATASAEEKVSNDSMEEDNGSETKSSPAAVAMGLDSPPPPLPPSASSSLPAETKTQESLATESSAAGDSSQKPLDELANVVITDDPKTMWTMEEDLRLLGGIRSHGLGNWVEIAEVVSGQGSSGKTPRRCMERYMDDFLGRYGHILPPYTLVMEDVTNDLMLEDGLAPENRDEAASASSSASVVANSSSSNINNSNNNNNNNNNKAVAAEKSEAALVEGTPRSSKRRAALMRSPSSGVSCGWTHRKRFRAVLTSSIEGYDKVWPKPYIPMIENVKMGDEVGRDAAYKAEQTYVRLTTAASSTEEAMKLEKEWRETKVLKPGGPMVLPPRLDDIVQMPGSELVGFMPRRGEFDIEWENDAEQAVADMEFLPGEPEEDRKLKLVVLGVYNSKLDERDKRKQFIISRQLWDYKKAYEIEINMPRDERDLINRMRLFERFHTPAEHKKFLEDILKAKRLRKEIAKLQMYRRMGIRTMAEAERFELDKQRRSDHRTFVQNSKDSANKRDEKKTPGDGRLTNMAMETSSTSLWKKYRTGERRTRKSLNRGKGSESVSQTSEAGDAGGGSTKSDDSKDNPEMMNDSHPAKETESPENGGGGFSTLSLQERDLCAKLDMSEEQYKDIKKAIICQSLSQGLLDKETIGSQKRAVVKMDIERKGQIIEFMLRAGWVSNKAATAMRSTSSLIK